jgi:hypothetical protein
MVGGAVFVGTVEGVTGVEDMEAGGIDGAGVPCMEAGGGTEPEGMGMCTGALWVTGA